jgi:hypothetical protein
MWGGLLLDAGREGFHKNAAYRGRGCGLTVANPHAFE